MEGIELLFGCRLCPPDTAQHHLDQFIAAVHVGVAQQGQQQRVSLAWLGHAQKVVHLKRRCLGRELAELGRVGLRKGT